jgi:hypothetical protein
VTAGRGAFVPRPVAAVFRPVAFALGPVVLGRLSVKAVALLGLGDADAVEVEKLVVEGTGRTSGPFVR